MNLRQETKPMAALPHPGRWALWWLAIRPRTLTLSAMPVIVGMVLAWADGYWASWWTFWVALACALLIQAATNLFNDASDYLRGNDGPDRLGPVRVAAAGLATPTQIKRAARLTFAAAFVGGIYLAWVGGWPIVAIGLSSLAAGWAYSGGRRPIAHTALGEVFVLLFFGVMAVAGSYFLQSGRWSLSAWCMGAVLGCHAAAVLLVNNIRDLEADRRVGRQTLAAVLGLARARSLYAVLMLAPFPGLVVLGGLLGKPGLTLSIVPALVVSAHLAWGFRRLPAGTWMNRQLARTAQAQVLLSMSICVGLLA